MTPTIEIVNESHHGIVSVTGYITNSPDYPSTFDEVVKIHNYVNRNELRVSSSRTITGDLENAELALKCIQQAITIAKSEFVTRN